MRRHRGLTAICSVVIALGLVEVGLRYVGGVFQDDLTQLDPQRGWSLRPNAAGWTRGENTLWIEINSDGLRDREHQQARDADGQTLRIAVLGDSYMEGQNVPLDKTFNTFLESALNRCLAVHRRTAESINFGVSGYGTAQELLTYRHHARKYQPDVVLLAFYAGNDVFNNHFDLNPTEFRELSPYFTLQDNTLVLDTGYQEAVAEGSPDRRPWWTRVRVSITDRLRTAQLLYSGVGAMRRLVAPPGEDDNGGPEVDEMSIYRPPASTAVIDAWRVTEALILELASEVRKDGADFWIVTLTTAEQVNPSLAERAANARRIGVESFSYPDERIRAFAAAHQIPVITLAHPLAEYSAQHQVQLYGGYNDAFPAGTGHWNEVGNEMAARIVAERLCTGSAAR